MKECKTYALPVFEARQKPDMGRALLARREEANRGGGGGGGGGGRGGGKELQMTDLPKHAREN
jgi:hypothetical protein